MCQQPLSPLHFLSTFTFSAETTLLFFFLRGMCVTLDVSMFSVHPFACLRVHKWQAAKSKCSMINSVFWLFFFGHIICSNSADCFRTHWTLTRSILQKQPYSFLRQKSVAQWPGHWPDQNQIELVFHLLRKNLKKKCPKNKWRPGWVSQRMERF